MTPSPTRIAFTAGAVLTSLLLTAPAVGAQTVYKCPSGASVVYSHEPCLGAQVVDTTPTQGMDKFTGQSRKGADVQRVEHRKMLAEAVKPITGMDAKQFEKATARQKLEPAARLQCDLLDGRLAREEARAARAGKNDATAAEAALFESRKQYRELRC